MDSIKVSPDATRMDRPHDALPFRMEQLSITAETADKLIAKCDADEIDWEWVNIFEIDPDRSRWSDDSSRLFEALCWHHGKKTQHAVSHAIEYFQNGGQRWDEDRNDDYTCFRVDGTVTFCAEQPPVAVEMLDRLTCSRLAIIPHWKKRGPNGLWLISRGQHHPVKLAAAGKLMYHVSAAGEPYTIDEGDGRGRYWVCELFSSRQLAEEHLRSEEELVASDPGCDPIPFRIVSYRGDDLLDLLSCFQAVYLDGKRYAVDPAARRFLDEESEILTPDSLT